ncbi:MAG: TolC family protein [Paludibacteraceae bacterium]|nr:TolC family protein [Paludibacteraceae bacterium]
MKKYFLWMIACLPVLGWAETFTLRQCIDTAYVNSMDIRKQQLTSEQKQVLYRQAWYNLSPSVSGHVAENLSFGRSTGVDNIIRSQNISNTGIGVNASMTLFDGLAMKFNIEEAKANKLASDANLEAVKRNVALNITALYLDVLLKKELATVAAKQVEETEQQVARVNAKVEAQRAPAGDLYEIEAQYSKDRYQAVQAENNVRLALLNLTQAMDIAYDRQFDVAPPQESELEEVLLPERDEVWQTALTHRPEIIQAQYSLQAAEKALKSAKSAYSPSLTAQAGVSTGYYHQIGAENTAFGKQLSDNFSTNVSFNLSIPIYDRMQTPSHVKTQQLNVENARLLLEQQKKTICKEIDQAYYNALAAQSEMVSARQAERSSSEAERYATEKYTAGRATVYEYYTARQTYLQAVSAHLQARYNYVFKVQILEYYMGL